MQGLGQEPGNNFRIERYPEHFLNPNDFSGRIHFSLDNSPFPGYEKMAKEKWPYGHTGDSTILRPDIHRRRVAAGFGNRE
jgi:hypothetical protein